MKKFVFCALGVERLIVAKLLMNQLCVCVLCVLTNPDTRLRQLLLECFDMHSMGNTFNDKDKFRFRICDWAAISAILQVPGECV